MSLIANMTLFVSLSMFFKVKFMYIMTFRVAYWDTLEMIVLHFNVQGEDDIIEHTNAKCHVFTF